MHDQTFDDSASDEGIRDLVHISRRDASISYVLRLAENGGADFAKVEATRCAYPHGTLGLAEDDGLLEAYDQLFRAFLGARPLRVVLGAPVRADEEVSLSERHGMRSRYVESCLRQEF